MLDLDYKKIPEQMVRMAFEIAAKLKMQSVAFDFVLDKNQAPVIVEISYGFGIDIGETNGYWDRNLQRHNIEFSAIDIIIESFIKELSLT